jgi:hypothetical protein
MRERRPPDDGGDGGDENPKRKTKSQFHRQATSFKRSFASRGRRLFELFVLTPFARFVQCHTLAPHVLWRFATGQFFS